MIELIITLILVYLILAYVGHYEGMMFGGSIIPRWLCVFCLFELLKSLYKRFGGMINLENKDNEEVIKIRRCDLHSIFIILCPRNLPAIDAVWYSVELMRKT